MQNNGYCMLQNWKQKQKKEEKKKEKMNYVHKSRLFTQINSASVLQRKELKPNFYVCSSHLKTTH